MRGRKRKVEGDDYRSNLCDNFSELVRRLDVLNMTRYRGRFYSQNTVSAFVFIQILQNTGVLK